MRWFKHQSNANMDGKLQEVLLDYGLEGYGLYWYCLELITGKVSADNITFSLEHDARIIARNTGSSSQKVAEMMTRFVELGLFENDHGLITCMKLAKGLDKSMTSNPEMRMIVQKLKESHDKVMTESGIVMQDKIRLDKNRIDIPAKAVKPTTKKFMAPSLFEVRDYVKEKGYSIDAQKFIDYYEVSNWHRGKTKIKCWKACVRTWASNDNQNTIPGGDLVI